MLVPFTCIGGEVLWSRKLSEPQKAPRRKPPSMLKFARAPVGVPVGERYADMSVVHV